MLKVTNDFSKMPEADLIINYTNQRLKRQHTNIFVIGLAGTGKSSTCLRLGELLRDSRREKFDMDPNIFLTSSLLEFVRALRQAQIGKDIIIIEEISVLFGSRRAMAGDNVDVNKIMDTCRKKRVTIISNAPLWGGIDSHMRAMGHLIIETLKINLTNEVVISKFHRLQTNPSSGKTYRHTMQRNGRDVSRMFTEKPSKEMWDKYEEDKDKFMDELYEKIERAQVKKKKKLDKEMMGVRPDSKLLSTKYLQVHQLVNVEKKTQVEASKIMNLSTSRIHQIVKEIGQISKNTKENEINPLYNQGDTPIK